MLNLENGELKTHSIPWGSDVKGKAKSAAIWGLFVLIALSFLPEAHLQAQSSRYNPKAYQFKGDLLSLSFAAQGGRVFWAGRNEPTAGFSTLMWAVGDENTAQVRRFAYQERGLGFYKALHFYEAMGRVWLLVQFKGVGDGAALAEPGSRKGSGFHYELLMLELAANGNLLNQQIITNPNMSDCDVFGFEGQDYSAALVPNRQINHAIERATNPPRETLMYWTTQVACFRDEKLTRYGQVWQMDSYKHISTLGQRVLIQEEAFSNQQGLAAVPGNGVFWAVNNEVLKLDATGKISYSLPLLASQLLWDSKNQLLVSSRFFETQVLNIKGETLFKTPMGSERMILMPDGGYATAKTVMKNPDDSNTWNVLVQRFRAGAKLRPQSEGPFSAEHAPRLEIKLLWERVLDRGFQDYPLDMTLSVQGNVAIVSQSIQQTWPFHFRREDAWSLILEQNSGKTLFEDVRENQISPKGILATTKGVSVFGLEGIWFYFSGLLF